MPPSKSHDEPPHLRYSCALYIFTFSTYLMYLTTPSSDILHLTDGMAWGSLSTFHEMGRPSDPTRLRSSHGSPPGQGHASLPFRHPTFSPPLLRSSLRYTTTFQEYSQPCFPNVGSEGSLASVPIRDIPILRTEATRGQLISQ